MLTRYTASTVLCIAIACALPAHAATIEARGFAGPALDPPSGSAQEDTETGSPLPRTQVAVADEGTGPVWRYAALADIATPKLQALAAIDNSAGPTLVGEFGGELPLLRASASLSDRISIVAPSADPYLVEATLVVDGVISGLQPDDFAFVNVQLRVDPVDKLNKTETALFDENVTLNDFALPISFQFSGDAEFDLDSSLFVSVFRASAGSNILIDFSNTAIITLAVTTLAGEPIENVVVTSESGNFGVTPVPLPATLPLMLSGLGLLAAGRRRVASGLPG